MKSNNINHIRELINKYYEGLSSKEEERDIAVFLQNNPDAKGFDVERAIFDYFSKEQKKKTNHTQPQKRSLKRYWTFSVAASLVILLTSTFVWQQLNVSNNYAYINGEKITDENTIKNLTIHTLNDVSEHYNTPLKCLQPFKQGKAQVQQQLSVFSDIEF